jgi:hypothetical protein
MQRKETTEIQKGFAAIFAEIIKGLLSAFGKRLR